MHLVNLLIERLLTRPLKWIADHPLLTAMLVVSLLILPPLIVAAGFVVSLINRVLDTFSAGKKLAAGLLSLYQRAVTFAGAPERKTLRRLLWIAVAALLPFGWLLWLWSLFDRRKTGTYTIPGTTTPADPTPTPPADPPPLTPPSNDFDQLYLDTLRN